MSHTPASGSTLPCGSDYNRICDVIRTFVLTITLMSITFQSWNCKVAWIIKRREIQYQLSCVRKRILMFRRMLMKYLFRSAEFGWKDIFKPSTTHEGLRLVWRWPHPRISVPEANLFISLFMQTNCGFSWRDGTQSDTSWRHYVCLEWDTTEGLAATC
jgi:hypothetical protein